LILVFDDLHWANDESLNLLTYLIENLSAPILLLCIGRPELFARRDAWTRHGGQRHTVLSLAPLSETDSAVLMHDLLSPCGEDPKVGDLVDAACTLAGGNPALLEHMVRVYLDMGVLEASETLGQDETWRIHADKISSVKLPLTVDEAVQARISALSQAERL